MKMYKGYDLGNLKREPVKEVAELSRAAAGEGIVLLENNGVLPFDKSKTLSLFGRACIDYVKCGTGSGGMVNTEYTVNILEGLQGRINLNQELLSVYAEWLSDNPHDKGEGWGKEPWAQKEMPVSDELCARAAENSDYALVVIGRSAGEDQDNMAEPLSYLLSETEKQLISTVTKHFDKVCVALNTGNIIDMKWVREYNVPCVLYCWQGGMEGGNALADIILGDFSPSGRLTDTIAYDIEDYPSTKNHGDRERNIYAEDIYVGYRYFETFAKDKVLYPFGYGLSYTNFECIYDAEFKNDIIEICASVKNIGIYNGKYVVQIYFEAPQGRLGKPARQLAAFAKTDCIKPGCSGKINIKIPLSAMASYDDTESFSYILEQGEYVIYAGNNVRDSKEIFRVYTEEKTVEELRQVLAPVIGFERIKPQGKTDAFEIGYEPVTTRQYDLNERMKEHLAPQEPSKGDCGIRLKEVKEGKNSLDEFVMQLSDEDMAYLSKGEGMNSPRVTAGTAAAFGGITDSLISFGIPPVCCADGPSGIRIDTGHKASLIPNGTCLASTWNEKLVEDIYEYVGIELRANEIDVLLAPGINIHRNPLCGRNFEYYSEDPHLSGKIAAACTIGLSNVGVAGSIKHFACNSQEMKRDVVDSVVSERALREIYLKPFEIAVKEGRASVVMTSYNCVNGIHSVNNYDLNTSILRDEWGFDGFVMSDWGTLLGSTEGHTKKDLRLMIEAQNDLYMVAPPATELGDNILSSVNDGSLNRAYLRKCAKNILNFILTSPAMDRKPKETKIVRPEDYEVSEVIESITSGKEYPVYGADALEFEFMTRGADLAQYVINVFSGERFVDCCLIIGGNNLPHKATMLMPEHDGALRFEFPSSFEFINVRILRKKQ